MTCACSVQKFKNLQMQTNSILIFPEKFQFALPWLTLPINYRYHFTCSDENKIIFVYNDNSVYYSIKVNGHK